jgi:hypothetical protein
MTGKSRDYGGYATNKIQVLRRPVAALETFQIPWYL